MNAVAGFGCQQQPNSHTSKHVPLSNSPLNQLNPSINYNSTHRYPNSRNEENFVGQREQTGMSLSNGNPRSLHVGREESKVNSQTPSLQFMPSVSSYLNSNRNPANGSMPSFSQKSCGLTSPGRLMSLPTDSDGRDSRAGVGEAPTLGNSDNCAFGTNGNGIIGEAVVQPSRQIANPPSPKTRLSNSLDYSSTPSLTKSVNGNGYQNYFPDLNELRLKTYLQNRKPSHVDKKVELAESMANIGGGIGIVPGQNPSNSSTNKYRDRDFQKSYTESMYPFVNGKTLQSQSMGSMNTNKDQTYSSTVSRAQDMIEKVKSEIGKAKSLVSLNKAAVANGEHSEDYWHTMGVPQFEDNLENKYLNRAKQQEYRKALELQIRQKEERKVLERRKEHEHPLGESQIENSLSFGRAKLGQYPNLRLPRNNFSRFENSVIHKSSFNTCGNKIVSPPPNHIPPSSNHKPNQVPMAMKPEVSQGYVNPQNYTVPLQQPSVQLPVQRPYLHPFFPNSQPAPLFPMQMPPPPPVQFYPHPMQTAQIPWPAPVYPYQQYLHSNQTHSPAHQQMQYMSKNSDVSNAEHWNKIRDLPNAQLPKPSPPSVNENCPTNCCKMPQNVDQHDQPLLVTKQPSVQLKQTHTNLEDEIDLDKLKEDDYEHKTKLKVWQTSDQLPDPELKMAFWKAELKRQIEEKRYQRQFEEAEATEAERKLDKKIQEHIEAERQDLNLGQCSTEQTLKHKLKARETGREHRVNNENETAWKHGGGGGGGGDSCYNNDDVDLYPANPPETRLRNNNGRKLSPPVPASQRSLQHIQNNRHAGLDSDIYELTSGKSHLQRPSASDPRFLNYLVRALENETEKQERKLRKKLQRNNK